MIHAAVTARHISSKGRRRTSTSVLFCRPMNSMLYVIVPVTTVVVPGTRYQVPGIGVPGVAYTT